MPREISGTSPTDLKTYAVPQRQADAVLSQANPVSGTWYPVLAATTNCRIVSVAAAVTWTVQPNIAIRLTIDGTVITHTLAAPVTTTYYEAAITASLADANQTLGAVAAVPNRAFVYEGRSVLVEASTTGGTTSALNARVKWSRW